MVVGTKRANLVRGSLLVILSLYFTAPVYPAKDNRPFWAEKSAFIEGDNLFVVGVASRVRTVEEGRRQAFEQGKVELMNYAQITSLEAQGLVVETQMTFEEPNADGTVTVYRLLRVPASKLVAIQGRLQAQSRTQEQTLEQSRKEMATIQQSLSEKAMKLDQQQRQVEQMLQQINAKLQLSSTTGNRSAPSGSLVDQLKETEAKLDASEQELNRLSRKIQERIKSRSQKACQHVSPGMTPSEVSSLLGSPDATNVLSYPIYGTVTVNFGSGRLVSSLSGCQR